MGCGRASPQEHKAAGRGRAPYFLNELGVGAAWLMGPRAPSSHCCPWARLQPPKRNTPPLVLFPPRPSVPVSEEGPGDDTQLPNPGSRDHPHRSLRPHTPASETLPADVRGLGAGGAHLAEADESGGRKSGPLGFVEGAVARNLVLEPIGSTPYRVTTLPFRASLYLLETGVFIVLKAVCCDNLTLNRWRKGIN